MQRSGFLFILVVLALVGASIWINLSIPPRLGLDIAGGVRFTIVADKSRLPKEFQSGDAWNAKAAQTLRILENRANQALGVAEANVVRKGDNKFIVELPGFKSEEEARKVITTSARLEYYWAKNVSTRLDPSRPYEQFTAEEGDPKREVHRFRRRGGTAEEYLPPNSEAFARMMERWEPITSGENLVNAAPDLQPNGTYHLAIKFNAKGIDDFNRFLAKVPGREENIAAVLDKEVISFAYIASDFTRLGSDGTMQLRAQFPADEAIRLANLLNAGALPVDLKEENLTKVNPSVGKQALSQILFAGAVSFVVIAAFLLVYYMFPGLVALLALLAYTTLCYAVFKWIGVTFSLAAIAGFILSIGMAVDANILIFERLKEELRAGRTLMTAIDLGFKRAFPAILDSNTCTVITSVVLANLGTGPVKGFATTLMIGVAISLFTAITVTRSLLLFFVSSGIGKNTNLYGLGRGWFGERLEANANERPLRIVGKMGRYFAISIALIVPGIIFMFMGGIRPNVEFLGGVESVVRLPQGNATANDLNQMLERAGFKGANAKIGDPEQGGTQPLAYITIPPSENPDVERYFELTKKSAEEAADEIAKLRADLGKRIVTAVGADASPIETTNPDGTKVVSGIKDEVSFESTGPAVREETIRGAILGILISSALIVIYLSFRFGVSLGGFRYGFRFGMSGIIAMLHDVLVILGLSAIAGYFLKWEVSQLTITAMLTVIGFSVHDTIVIFDRIRENLRKPLQGETFDNLVDRSITQSFARSLNTSGTVIVTLAILVFVGSATPDLKHFNAAMLIGILSGTYSSIFNAAPILVLWERAVLKRKGAAATIMHDERLREPVQKEKPEVDPGYYTPPPGYAQTKRKK